MPSYEIKCKVAHIDIVKIQTCLDMKKKGVSAMVYTCKQSCYFQGKMFRCPQQFMTPKDDYMEKKRKVKYAPKVKMHAELKAHNTSGNVFLCESI